MRDGSGARRAGFPASMRIPAILRTVARSRRARRIGAVAFSVGTLGLSGLTARHYVGTGWPLAGANLWLVAVAGILFFGAFVLKGVGWRRLFAHHERPGSHALAAANAAASVTGVALPGRFDDVVRI